MASIYDIAKVAGVSYSTVSLILNNRGDDVRISKKTQERVRKIAKEMGYVPNINARKLIAKDMDNIPEIALFWTPAQHPVFLNTIISKLNQMINEGLIQPMSVTIYPFENGSLNKQHKVLAGNYAHGFIIPLAYDEDRMYLEQMDIQAPVITIYGSTQRYHSVNVDNYFNGRMACQIFKLLGIKSVGIIKNMYKSESASHRVEGFSRQCQTDGIDIVFCQDSISEKTATDNTALHRYKNGCDMAVTILEQPDLPQGIFAQNDDCARGVVYTLKEHGIKVPEDIAVIGYGYNSDENAQEARITLIDYPMDTLVCETWILMNKLLNDEITNVQQILCASPVRFGQSCKKPGDFDAWLDSVQNQQ